jgi:hypothetical protein
MTASPASRHALNAIVAIEGIRLAPESQELTKCFSLVIIRMYQRCRRPVEISD